MRGAPHMHSLICVYKDNIEAEDIDSVGTRQDAVKHLITRSISATLVNRPQHDESDLKGSDFDKEMQKQEEASYDFFPSKDYFTQDVHDCNTSIQKSDELDPRRVPFNGSLNYSRNLIIDSSTGAIENDTFTDTVVQTQYRRLQLANQMHECCFTCYKYCKKEEKRCRFNFPWERKITDTEKSVIHKDRDKKARVRIRAFPPRNNANLNATITDPLFVIAHGANHDLQYIDNTVGAAEYASSYAGKYEQPDAHLLRNSFLKKIANLAKDNATITDRQRLGAIANAILGATQVGAPQCCYFLLGLDFVISSRVTVSVNALKRKQLIHSKYH